MKRILFIIAATLIATAAHARLPLMNATCPGGLSVHYDGKGHAYINGENAKFSPVGNSAYDIKHADTTVSIMMNPDNSIDVSYTGKDRAHGICQVENSAPTSSNASSGNSKPAVQNPESDAQVRAGSGQFDATGNIPCAQHKGQPMGQCQMGVARAGNGSATVVVTKPDGVKRAIFFSKGKAISADTSQADGYPEFRATKESDLYMIRVGDERYEIPEAVIYGG